MPSLYSPVSLGMNLFMLRIKKNCQINESSLWAFLNTNLGQNIIKRKINGTVPMTIDKNAIKSLYVPTFSKKIQTVIESIVQSAFEIETNSNRKYADAEQLLLSELGMTNFVPSADTVSVKSLSESFGASGRLDAEYYQPKYDYLMESLSHFENDALGKLVTIIKSIEPGSECYGDEGVPFVRVSDLGKTGLEDPTIKIPHDIVKNIEELYPKKDTILLSKDGSVGIAYKVEEDMQCVTSGAILHLTVIDTNKILPDYLTLVLNSPVVQMQSERDAGGSIIQHWKPSEIEKVVIPIFDGGIK
jgi:type I restriction enzyme S subunit